MVNAVNFNISNQAKVNRVYRLTVQAVDENDIPLKKAIVIDSTQTHLTMKFQVNRSIFAEINGANIDIYNLKLDTYRQLFYDYFNVSKRTVILEAGYDAKNMSIIFIGDMWSCYTSRVGTETVTHMECIVGYKQVFAKADHTLEGATRNQVLQFAANDMLMDLKIYSGEDTKFSRPVTIYGNAYKTIQEYSDNNAFIDNNTIYILKDQDAFEGVVPRINDASGLLGVPEHEDAILKINMIFEPRLMIGQIVDVESRIAPMFNGQYKIYGIRHEGEISDAEAGVATTTLEMLVGSQVYGRFRVKSPQ
jgi:hypothetical protein